MNVERRSGRCRGQLLGFLALSEPVALDPRSLQWLLKGLRRGLNVVAGCDGRLDPPCEGVDHLGELSDCFERHAGISRALRMVALAEGVTLGDLEQERQHAHEACRHARLAGDNTLLGQALATLAAVSGDDRAALLEQSASLLAPLGNYRAIANGHSAASYAALIEGHIDEATSYLPDTLLAPITPPRE